MIRRYMRAFFIALRMTLRGETPPPSPHTALHEWMSQGVQRVDHLLELAARHAVGPAAVVLKVDMRSISMATILQIVRYHLAEEYPVLLREAPSQSMTILHATNLDDHHRLTRLENAPELSGTPLPQFVAALGAHLEAVPKNE